MNELFATIGGIAVLWYGIQVLQAFGAKREREARERWLREHPLPAKKGRKRS